MNAMLLDFCGLYNACLQQRIEAYRRRRLSLRYEQQAAELKACRAADPDGLGRWSFTGLQQVLRKLDQAYAAFFKRGRGYPRFRASSRYHAAALRLNNGLTIKKDRRISVVGVPGGIKAVWHRDFPTDCKIEAVTLTRQQDKWFIIFSVEANFVETCGTGTVGVDLGLNNLVATSDGDTIEAPRYAHRIRKAQRRRQRALSRCKRGSNRRLKAKARLAAGSAHIARQRRDHLHKFSRCLVSRYQGIAFENLNITGLKRGILARSIHDAAWSLLVQLVQYKAENAGANVLLVDPRGTSQTCPGCSTVKPKRLSERMHCCECGCTLDRDIAAAMIVHQRAFGPGHGLRCISQRVAA